MVVVDLKYFQYNVQMNQQGNEDTKIAAIILAAGASRRMGRFKLGLDWYGKPVIQTIIDKLNAIKASPMVCVTGHEPQTVEALIKSADVHFANNHDFERGEMLSSYQAGLKALSEYDSCKGGLLVLGDQPHIPTTVFKKVYQEAKQHPEQLIFPSYQQRRGHPFYLPKMLWTEVLNLDSDKTMRDLIQKHATLIRYVEVGTDAIVLDMDTPEAYEMLLKRFAKDTNN